MQALDSVDVTNELDRVPKRHPTVGLAVGVVSASGLDMFHGHGVADTSTGSPITAATVFRIASITKTVTAIAVMQLWEQGLIDLDAPAREYLRSYELVPAHAGQGHPTVRHLLTHTAGLPEVVRARGVVQPDFGESVPAGHPLPTLAEFYGGALRTYAEPGSRFVYNNHGPATLGQLVADVSGQPLDRYFRVHVFEPLGMSNSHLTRTDKVRRNLATGYEIGAKGVRAVADREMITAGAASVYSPPRDMARYLAALLGGGSNDHGTILQPGTMRTMFAPAFQPDPRLPGIGLAFFRSDLGGHLGVGHQGTLPGFHSQITVAPDDGVAVMAFTNGAHQPDFWLPAEVAALLRRLVGAAPERVRSDVPHRPEVWDGLRGRYRLPARLTDVRLRAILGAGLQVFVSKGRPMVRFLSPLPTLYRGFPLHPDDHTDPYAFRIDLADSGLGTMRIVFGIDNEGTPHRAHLDLMPLTLLKTPRSGSASS